MPKSLKFQQKPFYTYFDTNGDGINNEYRTTYSESLIFDSYNRTIYAAGAVFGNHDIGSYHGEVFNDFDTNHAYGRYSSAHGTNVVAYNTAEAAFGKHNYSGQNSGILLSVGNGTPGNPSNAFEVHDNGKAYSKGAMVASDFELSSSNVSLSSAKTRLDEVDSYSYSNVSYLTDRVGILGYELDLLESTVSDLSERVLYAPDSSTEAAILGIKSGVQFVNITGDTRAYAPSEITEGEAIKVIYRNVTGTDATISLLATTDVILKSGLELDKTVTAWGFNDITFIGGPDNTIYAE